MSERIDATRKQIVEAIGGRRIKLRQISFSSLGYGQAYTLEVEDNGEWVVESGSRVYTRDYVEKHREVMNLMREVKGKFTFGGCKII